MKFKAKQFCIDYNIPHWESGVNVSPGWLNISCPLCGDKSSHGGINPNGGYYHCWRCGGHPLKQIIRTLLNITYFEVEKILKEYSGIPDIYFKKQTFDSVKKVELPKGTVKLNHVHKNYLISRRFNPDVLEEKYKIQGTSYSGNYAYRIIIPIYLDGKLVSYQGRSYSDKQIKYKACNQNNESIHHKNIVYNADNCKQDYVILVEGVTDVWRLGDDAAALFGMSFTDNQISFIKNRWKKVCVFFDPEIHAQKKAMKLACILSGLDIEVRTAYFPGDDPGSLSNEKAKNIKNQIVKEFA